MGAGIVSSTGNGGHASYPYLLQNMPWCRLLVILAVPLFLMIQESRFSAFVPALQTLPSLTTKTEETLLEKVLRAVLEFCRLSLWQTLSCSWLKNATMGLR